MDVVERIVTAYVSLGSNLGDPVANCADAAAALAALPRTLLCFFSAFYETEPVEGAGPQWFINGVVELQTLLSPRELLAELQEIERGAGRPAERARGKNRTLDLDLLLYGDMVLDEPGLQVPHPRLHLRRFVLEPLCSLAPDLVHPTLGRPLSELLEALPAHPVVRLAEDPWAALEVEQLSGENGNPGGRA